MHKLRILILYPDPAGLALLTSMLKSLGHVIEEATTDRAAVRSMERNDIDLVLAGVDPLDAEALELLMYVRRKHREVPVILLFPGFIRNAPKRRCGWGRWRCSSIRFRPPSSGRPCCRHSNAARLGTPSRLDPSAAAVAMPPKSPARSRTAHDSSPVPPRPAPPGPANSRPAAPSPLRGFSRPAEQHSTRTESINMPERSAWSATIRAGAR